jgi:membrane-bound ClpP family serine protease
MATGTSLVLIAAGAILRYAITAHVSWITLPTVGLVLMIVGIIGLIVSLFEMFVWAPRRRVAPVDDPNRTPPY